MNQLLLVADAVLASPARRETLDVVWDAVTSVSRVQILFLFVSLLGVLAALGTVLAKNLVHAALHLVAFFFIVACQFVLLEAEFLAAVQVLVYIGAVAILMMFGIMLTRNILGDDTTTVSPSMRRLSSLVALAVAAVLIQGISTQGRSSVVSTDETVPAARKPWREIRERPSIGPDENEKATIKAQSVNQMARFVGEDLLSRYVVAFEVAGILLTAALVGAIAIARQEHDDDPSSRVLDTGDAASSASESGQNDRPDANSTTLTASTR